MKKKTYTLLFNVNITWVEKNPWNDRKNLVDILQGVLENDFELADKIEVSCSEMQRGEKQA